MDDLEKSKEQLLNENEALLLQIAELKGLNKNHNLAVEALNKNENKMQSIYRVAPTGIGVIKNRVFTEVNPLVCEMTGYTKKELIGQSSQILYQSKKDFDFVGKEKYRQIAEFGTGEVETQWKKKDKSIIDILLASTPIDASDISKGVTFTALNITARKKAEDALRSSEERLKIIFESAPDAIYLCDFKGRFIDGNIAAEKMIGYRKEELIGKNFFDLNILSVKDIPFVEEALSKNVQGIKTGPDEYLLTQKDGNKVSLEITSYPIHINKNTVVLGIARDITERKRAEAIRRENEQQIALHVEQTPLGVIEWDLDFKVKKWNPSAERIFGFTAKEAIGKQGSFIVPDKYVNYVSKIWDDIVGMRGGERGTNENRNKNGEIILCEWYNTPLINENGKVLAVASLILDVTERLRAETIQKVIYNIANAVNDTDNLKKLIGIIRAELATIIDTTNFYIALYDEKKDTLSLPFFVDEMDEFSSFPAGKTLTGYVIKTKKSLLATNDVLQDLEKTGEIESFGTDSEIWLGVPLKADGKVIGVLALQSYTNKNAFNHADVKMLEFVSTQIGVSLNRKKIEVELKNALEKAKESDRLKSAFLANMSHEIRTPMNGILGFAELLKNPELSGDEQQNFIHIIEQSGKRMLGIIYDLIDISKIEAGQIEIKFSEFDINDMILYMYSFFKLEAEKKGLSLSYKIGLKEQNTIIESDREMVYATLSNLIKNAIKYTEKGSIEFGYEIKLGQVEFFVKDTGIGIPKNKLESIFDRFVQVDMSLSSNTEGAGLGLSISKAYVEMLGGEIWARSENEKGSSFYFKLPFVLGTEIKKKKDKILEIEPEVQIQNLKIILAEDDLILTKYFMYILKDFAGEIIHANTGTEAVEACIENPEADLVFMDIKMPEMNGFEATEAIRKFNKDIVIVAQTALAQNSDRDKAIAIGCNDYISKPVSRKQVSSIINKYFVSE